MSRYTLSAILALLLGCPQTSPADEPVGAGPDQSADTGESTLAVGSGSFLFDPPGSRSPIEVFYHRPDSMTVDSRVLLVIPGAGRNADSYRDAWVAESEAYSVLVLSPMYPESAYDFGAYHMVGTMRDLDTDGAVAYRENSNIVDLDEDEFVFLVETRKEYWILGDFDRIVAHAKRLAGLETVGYDAFGHSAGGQILHRFALLMPDSGAERIVAANSGFYTLPVSGVPLPFGLAGLGIGEQALSKSFSRHLVVLVGKLDNEHETGGTLLRSPSADEQGTHRLARARFFVDFAGKRAKEIGTTFNWQLIVVDGVGHNHRGMGDAAARILYEGGE